MQAFCRFFFRLFCKLFVKLQNSRFYRSPARRNPYINSIAAQHLLPCGCFCLDLSLGSPAQSPPDGFARNLLADFPSYCPEIPCQTQSLPAEFLNNLPKNPAAHLTHKLCAVSPLFLFFTAYFFFSLSDSQQHAQRRHGQKDAVPCPFQLQKE